jgi:hypothetical protein
LHAGRAAATEALGFSVTDLQRKAEHHCCGHQYEILHGCLRVEKLQSVVYLLPVAEKPVMACMTVRKNRIVRPW